MCKIVALPPGITKNSALSLLKQFAQTNPDGTGYVYINNGEFVVKRWAQGLDKVLVEHEEFLEHLPHDGWTLIHLRHASYGRRLIVNTHPFIIDNLAIVHNGSWADYKIAKLALSKFIKFRGNTDSEVAARLIAMYGHEKFIDAVDNAGVFISLNKDNGELTVIKTSGCLMSRVIDNNKEIIASILDFQMRPFHFMDNSWYVYNSQGQCIEYHEPEIYSEDPDINDVVDEEDDDEE